MNSFQAHITVATVVEHEGRLLFVRETQNGEAVINQPAGHAEFGEDLMQGRLPGNPGGDRLAGGDHRPARLVHFSAL